MSRNTKNSNDLLETLSYLNSIRLKLHDPNQITPKGILSVWFDIDKKFNNGKGIKKLQNKISRTIKNLFF